MPTPAYEPVKLISTSTSCVKKATAIGGPIASVGYNSLENRVFVVACPRSFPPKVVRLFRSVIACNGVETFV
jgi:hypothetical protein